MTRRETDSRSGYRDGGREIGGRCTRRRLYPSGKGVVVERLRERIRRHGDRFRNIVVEGQ